MEKSINDIWGRKIEFANSHNLTMFVFLYKEEYYFSEWIKLKWSEPVKIELL